MFAGYSNISALLFLCLIGANDVYGHAHEHSRIPAFKRAASTVTTTFSRSATTAVSRSPHNSSNITSHFTQSGKKTALPSATLTHHETLRNATSGVQSKSSATTLSSTAAANLTSQLDAECILWNHGCSGNETLATELFFGKTLPRLLKDYCFTHQGEEGKCTNGTVGQSPWQFAAIKDYMRSSECGASLAEYDSSHNLTKETVENGHDCCGVCMIEAQNVYIHYWPEQHANKSCLSIVGDGAPHGLYHGATTDAKGKAYWGCTSGTDTITTAQITTLGMGPLSVKETIVDPWGPQPCTEESSIDPSEASSSFHAHLVPLSIQHSITHSAELPASTAVHHNFTL